MVNTLICWLWVWVPVVGFLPGYVPLRLSTQWLSAWMSAVVILASIHQKASIGRNPFGWVGLCLLAIALCQYKTPSSAFVFGIQASILLCSAAFLQESFPIIRKSVIALAWFQAAVCLIQLSGNFPIWPTQPYLDDNHLVWGTVGSKTPASIIIGLGALMSKGFGRFALGLFTIATQSATVASFVSAVILWPLIKRLYLIGIMSAASVAVLVWSMKSYALVQRLEVWSGIRFKALGHGFHSFPGGFRDDTPLGMALGWIDYHNAYLDFALRFGVPGIALMAVMVLWAIRNIGRSSAGMTTVSFFAWVAFWQSFEQFPVLIPFLLIGIMACNGSKRSPHAEVAP